MNVSLNIAYDYNWNEPFTERFRSILILLLISGLVLRRWIISILESWLAKTICS